MPGNGGTLSFTATARDEASPALLSVGDSVRAVERSMTIMAERSRAADPALQALLKSTGMAAANSDTFHGSLKGMAGGLSRAAAAMSLVSGGSEQLGSSIAKAASAVTGLLSAISTGMPILAGVAAGLEAANLVMGKITGDMDKAHERQLELERGMAAEKELQHQVAMAEIEEEAAAQKAKIGSIWEEHEKRQKNLELLGRIEAKAKEVHDAEMARRNELGARGDRFFAEWKARQEDTARSEREENERTAASNNAMVDAVLAHRMAAIDMQADAVEQAAQSEDAAAQKAAQTFTTAFSGAVQQSVQAIGDSILAVAEHTKSLGQAARDVAKTIARAFANAAISFIVTKAAEAAASAAKWMIDKFGPVLGGVLAVGAGAAAFAGIYALTSKVRGAAAGGVATGGQPGRDSVPAFLMPMERVLTVKQNALFEGLLGALEQLTGGGQLAAAGAMHLHVHNEYLDIDSADARTDRVALKLHHRIQGLQRRGNT